VLILRSFVFNLLFYVVLVAYVFVGIPTFFLPYRAMIGYVKFWARTNIWLLRVVCGTRVEIIGMEKVIAGAPLMVAAKHQSAFETFALFPLFSDPSFVLKRELQWIPLFGWMTIKARQIPVDRSAGVQALKAITDRARAELARGRQVVIFPEGTRRAPGAEPDYKVGIAHIYRKAGVPCLPVALNSGVYWPRRSFMRYPGTIRIEFLDPIPPGLAPRDFMRRLQEAIEPATARLVAQGLREVAAAAPDSPLVTEGDKAG
jgi:1-acyl-sn-glycerol-3-phosphate acyltransferase